MNVILLAIDFNQSRLKPFADPPKDRPQAFNGITIKDLSTVFCDKD